MEVNELNTYGIAIPEWYKGYVNSLGESDFMDVLIKQYNETPAFLSTLPEAKWDYAYNAGKWTIKELLIHLIDCERIFSYRSLCFARNDQTELPGFDENEYAPNSGAGKRNSQSIIDEYKAVRKSTIELFKNFDEEMLFRKGIANGKAFTVKLSGAIIAGHEIHHMKILKERYL